MNEETKSLGSISDEIRDWCDGDDPDCEGFWKLRELADRIDNEMVELPKDKDGETIRIGDVTHDCFIDEDVHIEGMVFKSEWEILTDFGRVKPHWLTHTIPDSLERIAEDIEAAEDWCDREGEYGTGITSVKESTLREWADRIRKLAKKEDE